MTTIFTLLVCTTFPNPADTRYNGCSFPDNGPSYYQSEAECQRVAKLANAAPNNHGAVDIEWKCFSKSVNTWQEVR